MEITFKDVLKAARAALAVGRLQIQMPLKDISDEGGACRYRSEGSDGKMYYCAFGAAIPDNLYNTRMEGIRASSVVNDVGFKLRSNELDLTYIDHAQRAHDEAISYFAGLSSAFDSSGAEEVRAREVEAFVQRLDVLEAEYDKATAAEQTA